MTTVLASRLAAFVRRVAVFAVEVLAGAVLFVFGFGAVTVVTLGLFFLGVRPVRLGLGLQMAATLPWFALAGAAIAAKSRSVMEACVAASLGFWCGLAWVKWGIYATDMRGQPLFPIWHYALSATPPELVLGCCAAVACFLGWRWRLLRVNAKETPA